MLLIDFSGLQAPPQRDEAPLRLDRHHACGRTGQAERRLRRKEQGGAAVHAEHPEAPGVRKASLPVSRKSRLSQRYVDKLKFCYYSQEKTALIFSIFGDLVYKVGPPGTAGLFISISILLLTSSGRAGEPQENRREVAEKSQGEAALGQLVKRRCSTRSKVCGTARTGAKTGARL